MVTYHEGYVCLMLIRFTADNPKYRIVPYLRPPPNYRPPLFFQWKWQNNFSLSLFFFAEILKKDLQFMEYLAILD